MASTSQYSQLNDEAWLRRRYIDEGCTVAQIAAEIGCHRQAVTRVLQRFGIITTRGRRPVFSQLQNSAWLRREIVQKPTRQIADELGCTPTAVRLALAQFDIRIPKRTKYRRVDKSDAIKQGLARRYPKGRSGSDTSNWKGGRTKRGPYWWLHRELVAERWPNHPRLARANWSIKQEHILVMEAHLGRLLTQGEVVDHGPGGKEDNRIENLTLRGSQSEHIQHHWQEVPRLRALLDAHGIPYDTEP